MVTNQTNLSTFGWVTVTLSYFQEKETWNNSGKNYIYWFLLQKAKNTVWFKLKTLFKSVSCYQIIKYSLVYYIYGFCLVEHKAIFHPIFFTDKVNRRGFKFGFLTIKLHIISYEAYTSTKLMVQCINCTFTLYMA